MDMTTHTVIRATWLSRKLDAAAPQLAGAVALLLWVGAMLYWTDQGHAAQWMAATRAQVFEQRQWWRAWTTLFVHADIRHLLSNSLLFFVLGTFVNGYFGPLIFPLMAFAMGGITNLWVLNNMRADTELIGVSGVVFWLGAFWLILYFVLDRRRTWVQRFLRAGGVGLGLFMPAEAFDPSISYASHLVGFVSGLFCGAIYFFCLRRRLRAAEVIEIVNESDEILDV